MSYCVRQWGNPLGLRSNDRNSALVNDVPRDLPGGIVLYWSVGVFVGQYDHAIDSKGRVVLPAPFRAFVAERGYVTQLDGCIGLWNAEHFTQVAQKWKTESEAGRISMRVFRKLMSSALLTLTSVKLTWERNAPGLFGISIQVPSSSRSTTKS